MSEYTPTTDEVETHWADVGFAGDRESFRRWLAEVERSAAYKALTDAVDDWESGTVEHDEIKHTSDAPLGWGDGSVVDAVMASGPVMTWLRKRAAAYRREETE